MELNAGKVIRNEMNQNAMGGTELSALSLFDRLEVPLMREFQIFHGRIRELDESKIRIAVMHDLPEDPECSKLKDSNLRNKFHKIVYVSNWQYSRFQEVLKIPYSDNDIVIENGIAPITPNPDKTKDVINLIYTSTPQRGLGILVPVFEALQKTFNNIHLHIFSSFEIYGWSDMDTPFKELFDKCKSNPGITYHGFQPYEKVREQLSNSHIFAYPSVWQETSCRALIEAMSAGLLCVHPNYAALPDTSGGLNMMYQGDGSPHLHANIFYNVLYTALQQISQEGNNLESYLNYVKSYSDNRYNISKIVSKWDFMMRDLLAKFPDEESRKFQQDMLIFNTGA
ncbi:MAG: glycosyltransferase family 4 protein [Candidatus Levybacteria bacterium]|nr:glycosyltransferase family 4 protein [Candidatus Levybacteria bacterium]